LKTLSKVGIGAGVAIAGYFTIMFVRQAEVKEEALARALELSGEKGIINLGAGCSRNSETMDICRLPEIITNIDKTVADCPKCSVVNLEDASLPYADKTFDVAFASHVLEHINNWRAALEEWIRVSDHQIIVLPSPYFLGGHTSIHHVNFFSFSDMNAIVQEYPSVEIFS
jgi:SAM-dependent methyltransferase